MLIMFARTFVVLCVYICATLSTFCSRFGFPVYIVLHDRSSTLQMHSKVMSENHLDFFKNHLVNVHSFHCSFPGCSCTYWLMIIIQIFVPSYYMSASPWNYLIRTALYRSASALLTKVLHSPTTKSTFLSSPLCPFFLLLHSNSYWSYSVSTIDWTFHDVPTFQVHVLFFALHAESQINDERITSPLQIYRLDMHWVVPSIDTLVLNTTCMQTNPHGFC